MKKFHIDAVSHSLFRKFRQKLVAKVSPDEDPIINSILQESKLWNAWINNCKGKRILIATSMAGYAHGSAMDRLLSVGLTARGHSVAFLMCDSSLQACQLLKYSSYEPQILLQSEQTPRCGKCAPLIKEKFSPLSLPVFSLDSISADEESFLHSLEHLSLEELRNFIYDSINIGLNAWAGAIRYFAKSNISEEVYCRQILIRFLLSAKRLVDSCRKVIQEFKPDIIIAHHGIYIPQGVIAEVARNMNICLMTWTASYRKGTFIFSPLETYHHSMVDEPTDSWENLDLSKDQMEHLDSYLTSRAKGSNDWISFSDSKLNEHSNTVKESDYFLALTSVTWDAELHYEARAFSDIKEWLKFTVKFFQCNPQLKLKIRIHPAEITSTNPSREPLGKFLKSLGISEHPNIEVIDSSDMISTYELIDCAKAVIIFNTKTGIEAAYRGKPVIIAGESWLKGKGIGWDVYNSKEYHETLSRFEFPIAMTPSQIERAKKYAYHFFFRRMIRVELFSDPLSSQNLFGRKLYRLDDLAGFNDPNFIEILQAIEESRVPLALRY